MSVHSVSAESHAADSEAGTETSAKADSETAEFQAEITQTAGLQAEELDYGRDIRPILSNNCFQCHGADEETRHADLRLDEREAALAALIPGNANESELIRRILSDDSSEVMPPVDSNKSLKPEEVERLKTWINQGAKYSSHWSFASLKPVTVPELSDKSWAKNEIDLFILQKQQSLNLKPSEPANRHELIRRLSQDVTGLLPTPEEVNRFVNATGSDPSKELISELLSSPHYGERWGRHWLDQARYADSDGFTIDGERVMWPYRDWVINAINQDLPFDQFTIEQLAGDLLPEPTQAQLVATAFHRNTLINTEGGVKADQFRHEAIVDRVNTTAAVWMGMTLACAQCHTHKFDPLTHRDYYSMYAFFNQCADQNNVGPTVSVYEDEMLNHDLNFAVLRREYEQADQQLKKLKSERDRLLSGANRGLSEDWHPVTMQQVLVSGAEIKTTDSVRYLLSKQPDDHATISLVLSADVGQVSAIRIQVLPHDSLPASGPGFAENGNFVLTSVKVQQGEIEIPLAAAYSDHEQENYPASALLDDDPKSGWAINVSAAQRAAKPDLKMNAEHEVVLHFRTPVHVSEFEPLKVTLEHGLHRQYVIGHFAVSVSPDLSVANQSENMARLEEEISQSESVLEMSRKRFPRNANPVRQMVMKDQPAPVATYRLHRGDFLSPVHHEGELNPAPPEVLQSPQEHPARFQNRLDLAKWLIDPENPLTARVTVNRVWMRYFGRGLVVTENDIGYQGSLPSHPELLDYLANYLIDHDWSMKALHRHILESATYQQSSAVNREIAERDAENIWLTRQNRFRVEAEIVRDQSLSASSLLNPRIGGPNFYPPQPDGVYQFTQTPKKWPTSTGEDRHRRSLYTTFYRSSPHPMLATFDSPDFSTVCTARPRSNTPLQALALANDINFVEPAQALAIKIVRQQPDPSQVAERLEHLFLSCLSRSPTENETQVLIEYSDWISASFEADPESETHLFPESLPDDLNPRDVGVWFHLVRVILNTDEFVTRN